MQLKDKVVLVTGAANGTGKAIAKSFLEEGAIVIAADIQELKWDAGKYEDKIFRYVFDISDEEAVNRAIDEINKKSDGISILVNNAGISLESKLQDLELEMWEKVFAINTRGTFLCTKAVVKNMLSKNIGGSIINISSIAGRNAFPGSSAYSASKAAVIGFTRALAAELGPHDIRVNAICPGSVDTDMLKGIIENISENTGVSLEETRKMMEDSIPLKRFQTPEDIAAMAVFLASDCGKNINGESINLDGGVVRC
ncbi:SDR family NAD(P)-dependent oxidoreductase [Clostridium sp. Cult3]|uniref:SDR family NAD(P)-dependent oxidoreductase n=1 Tax=Clostridium sp. Cult3 TaxID=2079004 RepID=UPI001F17627F|nr:SDR family NAD(P)-dependent oxidoreductase [Clostridium sp. Cult3]MCF6460160.1 SDR family oxidoreductase [Clostridium sp. Cult3]